MAHKIIGTAGHIDHGKTSLVRVLTGIDTDRLKEEKEREITIDLGFAFMEGDIAFIDVPGHEKFVKNMVAGVTGIDLALLVIAADDGIMPQTREHLDIIKLLKIDTIVTALTKIDSVDKDWTLLVKDEVSAFLTENAFENIPVIPCSSATGDGIEELKRILVSELSQSGHKELERPFRLPVDRAFSMTGFGTVVTGTVISGSVKSGDTLTLYTEGRELRLRGLQTQNRQAETLSTGERGALNFSGIQKKDVIRGDIIAASGSMMSSENMNCMLHYLGSADKPLKYHERVRLHCGTAEVIGRIAILDREYIEPGDHAPVQIQLEKPIAAVSGDRFIIRRYSPQFTIGGGEIIEAAAKRIRKNRKILAANTVQAAEQPIEQRILFFVESHGSHAVSLQNIAKQFGLFQEHIEKILKDNSNKVVDFPSEDGQVWIGLNALNDIQKNLSKKVEDFHDQNPSKPGIPHLKLLKDPALKFKENILKFAVDTMISEKSLVQTKEVYRLPDFKPEVELQIAGMKLNLLDMLEEKGINAPTIAEAASELHLNEQDIAALIDVMSDEGDVVLVHKIFVYSQKEIDRIRRILEEYLQKYERIALADFRTLIKSSRKYALPLLEHFDNIGFTARVGDDRMLK